MPYICQCGCGQEIPHSPLHGYRYEPRFIAGHNIKLAGEAARKAQTTAKEKRQTANPVLICACGCGEEIPWKREYRYRAPKYIHAHYLKLGTHLRIDRYREEMKKHRTPPPEGWVPPSGWCECGCGGKTTIVKSSKPEDDSYCGYPRRFIRGHHMRNLPPDQAHGWQGGRMTTHQGYVLIHKPDHHAATVNGYVPEHRLVYEESRGIKLPKSMQVHHLNGIRNDNRPENLEAMTNSAHKRAHQFSQCAISLFFDMRLLKAAMREVRATGLLPDLEALTQEIYSPSENRQP